MTMPGFTAEVSLYKPTTAYQAVPNSVAMIGGPVVPALLRECFCSLHFGCQCWVSKFACDDPHVPSTCAHTWV